MVPQGPGIKCVTLVSFKKLISILQKEDLKYKF